jgi:hypothetical protein
MKSKLTTIIRRWSPNNPNEWLFLKRTTTKEIIEAKQYPGHGDVVRSGNEGNGYHGNCSQCGLA